MTEFVQESMENLNMPVKIHLNDQFRIQTIQEEFNKNFPYLMLEFSYAKNKSGNHHIKINTKQTDKLLGEFRLDKSKKKILITPDMTVADLEQVFISLYGLTVKVHRKSGKSWIKTSVTDYWTLEEQNNQGEALSK